MAQAGKSQAEKVLPEMTSLHLLSLKNLLLCHLLAFAGTLPDNIETSTMADSSKDGLPPYSNENERRPSGSHSPPPYAYRESTESDYRYSDSSDRTLEEAEMSYYETYPPGVTIEEARPLGRKATWFWRIVPVVKPLTLITFGCASIFSGTEDAPSNVHAALSKSMANILLIMAMGESIRFTSTLVGGEMSKGQLILLGLVSICEVLSIAFNVGINWPK